MPRCAASFVQAVLMIPVPPMNRTFMKEFVAGRLAARPAKNAPNLGVAIVAECHALVARCPKNEQRHSSVRVPRDLVAGEA